MKFGGQIVLALVAIVGLVAGVTYLSHYRVTAPPTPTSTPVVSGRQNARPPNQLNFPITVWAWETGTAGEFEMQTKASETFWFDNPSPVDFDLGVNSVSCKCSGLSFCIFDAEEKKRYQRWVNCSAAAELAAGFAGPLSQISQINADQTAASKLNKVNLNWDEAKPKEDKSRRVPAGGGGLVKIGWTAKSGKVGEERIVAALWSQPKVETPTPRQDTYLEITVRLVPVVRVLPLPISEGLTGVQEANIGDIYPHDEKFKDFVCWSSVRAGFALKAEESTKDPCFHCTCTPLSSEDCKALSAMTQAAGYAIRALAGYRIRVTVRERLNDQMQMDLGPFSRKIKLTSDPDVDESNIRVTGVVRGDVTVGSESDNGRIVLGTIRSSTGYNKVVKISSPLSGLSLDLERVDPPDSFVKMKSLKPARQSSSGGSHWELAVEVPRGVSTGVIPEHTAVILRIPGNPPRRIRIPVTGIVYQ